MVKSVSLIAVMLAVILAACRDANQAAHRVVKRVDVHTEVLSELKEEVQNLYKINKEPKVPGGTAPATRPYHPADWRYTFRTFTDDLKRAPARDVEQIAFCAPKLEQWRDKLRRTRSKAKEAMDFAGSQEGQASEKAAWRSAARAVWRATELAAGRAPGLPAVLVAMLVAILVVVLVPVLGMVIVEALDARRPSERDAIKAVVCYSEAEVQRLCASQVPHLWARFGFFLPSRIREKVLGPDLAEHTADLYEELVKAETRGKQNRIIIRFTVVAFAKVLACSCVALRRRLSD